MLDFKTFTNKGKLYIETELEESSEEWKMSIDVSKIWTDYDNKSISLLDFNNNYATILIENQQNITSTIGDFCWNEIHPLAVNDLREATNNDESEIVYNKLYDIFDKYEIKIN